MTKFGELINVKKPVLIDFYFDWSEEENNLDTLKDVAAALGDKAKVIKIDIKKNEILADTLRVKGNPTFMIYKNRRNEMASNWRARCQYFNRFSSAIRLSNRFKCKSFFRIVFQYFW